MNKFTKTSRWVWQDYKLLVNDEIFIQITDYPVQ